MSKLVIKNSYIKGGRKKSASHISNLVKYVATRDGVQTIANGNQKLHNTDKQEKFIQDLLKDFPDSKKSHEYQDYLESPTRENASEFIETTLEQQAHKLLDSSKYLDYIANRPRVEVVDQHGLFSSYGSGKLDLAKISKEMAEHKGNIWTPIISLKREDAERMACDSAESWQAVLNAEIVKIAESFKIHPDNFRWYAAFHNEGHHPHVHFICYSTNDKEGFLTKDGIEKMMSALTNQIFKDDLLPLYKLKTENRDQLKGKSRDIMVEMIEKMQSGLEIEPRTEELIVFLAKELETTKGKKQYGYLKPQMKNLVDEIVNQLGKIPEVEECYEAWWQTQEQINQTYSDTSRDKPPLSQNKEFKSIKNMVIQEAMKYEPSGIILEEPPNWDEIFSEPPEEFRQPWEEWEDGSQSWHEETESTEPKKPPKQKNDFWQSNPKNWWNKDYKEAKNHLYGNEKENIPQDVDKAFEIFSEQENNPLAQLELGKMYEKGLGCEVDVEKARECEEHAFSLFCQREEEKPWQYTQYRIGKMMSSGIGTEQNYEEAVDFLTKAYESDPEKPHIYAAYSLAGLYKKGLGVDVDEEQAFEFYKVASTGNFPFADFEVAKAYETGSGTKVDTEKSQEYYKKALDGFLKMEQQGCDDKLLYRVGKMFLDGKGTEIDLEKAKEYFEKAAKVGNQFACYQLAKILLAEETVDQETLEQAVRYLEIAAQQENPMAQYQLGKLYRDKKSPLYDVLKAENWLKQSAEHGNEYAEYALGKLYLDKESPLYDVLQAEEWLKKSAEQGNEYAQYTLGKLYLEKESPLYDVSKAEEWLKKSAEQGNQYALYTLGMLYTNEQHSPKDLQKAMEYFQKSAEQGNAMAQYMLAKIYLEKDSLLYDVTKAEEWLLKSAEQGNEFAQYQVGKLYFDKESPLYDVAKAVEWLEKSAEQGNSYAQYTLGKLYFFGEDVPEDKEKAWDYFKKSAEQGNEYAQFYVDHFHNWGQPPISVLVGQLLNQLSKVFEDNLPPMPHKAIHRLDRKRFLQLAQKKEAQGHRRDDFYQQSGY
ncbi:MAG: MobP3 family relaxase [Eubacteriales bacterium]